MNPEFLEKKTKVMKVKCKIRNEQLRIVKVHEVITNSLVNMILPHYLIKDCVTFLEYQKFGKYDQEVEQMLIDKVNKFLKEQ